MDENNTLIMSAGIFTMHRRQVCAELVANHHRCIAHSYLQNMAEVVGAVAAAKEGAWHYATPTQAEAIATVREQLQAAITQVENHRQLMNQITHPEDGLPIGSEVTEAACKTLIK